MSRHKYFKGLFVLLATFCLLPTQARRASTDIELVDLGLSVKWANMNIDATATSGAGDFYAWGEITTKSDYSWESYTYCSGSAATCKNIGSNISGNARYDRAYDYSSKLSLPTAEQWNELISQCTWKETTVNGVKGYNVQGPSGKSIFLPFSGCSYDGKDHGVGSYVYYWTSNNVTSDVSKAQSAYLKSGTKTSISNINRRTGAAIRAVGNPKYTELVDLGLSVMWASSNIDAADVSEAGGFYAWGETTTKSNYSWGTYVYCSGTAASCLDIGSNISCNARYDRAYNFSRQLCLPTAEQWNELISQCTWKETTVNGVKGYNVKGPSGKSIFLPFSGCSYDGGSHGSGSNAYYWTSNNVPGEISKAQSAYIKSGTKTAISNINRRTGAAIRAVEATNTKSKQYALYNYRNDGEFNGWLNIDVDSITYSCVDTLGVEHDDVVVQEVWTPDSLYRIPMEAIDSIGFRAPEPVYKENIFHIRKYHIPYISKVEGLTLSLNKGIKRDSLPSIGQIIISDVIEEPLPRGFSGRVLSIETTSNSFVITCEAVALTDIFERLLLVGRSESFTPEEMLQIRRARRFSSDDTNWDGVIPFEVGTFSLNIPSIEGFMSNSKSDMTLGTISVTPKFCVSYIADIRPFVHSYVKVLFENKSKVSTEMHLKVSGESSLTETKKARVYLTKIPIPLVTGVLYGEVAVSGELALKGNLDLKATFTKNLYNGDEFEWSTSDFWNINHKRYDKDPKKDNKGDVDYDNQLQSDVTFSVNGSFGFGASLDLVLFAVSENTLEISNTTTVGPELSGSIKFSSEGLKDGTLYSTLKNTNISFTPLKLSDDVKFNICMREFTLGSYSKDFGKKEFRLFPDFESLSVSTIAEYFSGDYNPLGLYTTVTNDVIPIIPLKLGIGRYDNDDKLIDESFSSNYYQYEDEWDRRWLTYDLSKLASGQTYTFHPLIRMWGLKALQLKATPKSKISIPQPVSLSPTSIQLAKGGSNEVSIIGGWGDYKVESKNSSIASVNIITHNLPNGVTEKGVVIKAKSVGKTDVRVIDERSHEEAVVSVTVTDGDDVTHLQLSATSITLTPGQQGTVDVTSGSGSYVVKSSDKNVATATREGSKVTITAVAVGSAVITVKDQQTNETADIQVTVSDNQHGSANLQLSTTSLTLTPGSQRIVDVVSGSGSYAVKSSNTNVATATRNGSKVTITAVAVGSAVITVKDQQTNETADIQVTVAEAGTVQSETITVNGVSFKMIDVEGGTFRMGRTFDYQGESDEYPVHQVTLSDFAIGETEVTQELWEAVMGYNPFSDKNKDGNKPIAIVSWKDCQLFIGKLNKLTGRKFRLPTEAEWEYAARGGKYSQGYKYAGSNNIDDVGWIIRSGGAHIVAQKQANELGLYDMSGNVLEWCDDWYDEDYYRNSPKLNPCNTTEANGRVIRGGSWNDVGKDCTVCARDSWEPNYRDDLGGLRLAMGENGITHHLVLSNTIPIIQLGENSFIEILSGSGIYVVNCSDTNIATAKLESQSVKITTIGRGTAYITVKDELTNETVDIHVTVNQGSSVQTKTYSVNGVSFKMVEVESGSFWMGSPEEDYKAYVNELPLHQVSLSSYAIGQTEVTQALWETVMGNNPSYVKDENSPVYGLKWEDCQEFISKLNAITGEHFRLPTEAEWEYAARGGKNSCGYIYAGSNDLDAVAWKYNYADRTYPVAQKQPNELNIYDMSGNAMEWCQDWYYYDYYNCSPTSNPCNTTEERYHVVRGGGNNTWGDTFYRVAWRDGWDTRCGLRLAKSLE